MKKIIYSLILVVLLGGCNVNKVIPSGEVVETFYEVSGFSNVQVENDFHVIITEGEEFSMTVTTHENLFEYFEIEVVGDVLQVGYVEGTDIRNPNIQVVVTLKNLEGVYAYNDTAVDFGEVVNVLGSFIISGNDDAQIRGSVSALSVEIDLHNDSSLDIDLYSTRFYMEVYDDAFVDIDGLTTSITLEGYNYSIIDLEGIPAGVANITMYNNATAKVKNVLEVNATLHNESILECRQVITINELFIEEDATIEKY